MQEDILNSIRQTELKAEAIRNKARDEARQIIADARKNALDIIEKGVQDSEKEAAEFILKSEKEAQENNNSRQTQLENDVAEIINAARENIPSAVNLIFERIVNL